ncbi:ATP-dependent DNA ligase [Klebsormidium nitens]|uniref:DNA ligase n=1 Tax=Klebsormidium nitens TaxID=105231 RepID=A0A1Y1HUB1_KLENI|nr:ATP-dependent DNA ligase [Klebsormidium nitens]|eukprot:GAQ80116.1 ATP-dependent DNA ligase [Klebsormidium nitens]
MAEKATSSRGHGDSTHFSVLVDLFEAVIKAKKGQMKRKHLSTFFNFLGRDYFSAMRLMIPELDKERGNYNVGADKLAKFTADALGLGKDTSDAKKLIEWKRGGARAGKSAGNFAMVAFEVLQNRQRETSGGLTIRELNETLDKLVAAEKREAKTSVLTELINKTNAREMKWVVNIILKDLKMGISEKTIFSEFHPDAEDIFNVTCDLRAVCEKLKDRTKRFARQDIEIGKAVRPQLAARVNTVEQAMKKMRGRPVVVECKFDGERIQCHIDGTQLNFFSRNFNDHAEIYRGAIGDDIIKQTKSSRCILDGEIVVWNNVLKSFTPFGTNKTIAKQDGDGIQGDETSGLPTLSLYSPCRISLTLGHSDIIFDILYHDDRSLIHLPLRERHEMLKQVVTPLKHRIEVLVPDAKLNREPGVQPWTIIPASAEEAQTYFLEMVENRDEGVIIKDLESKWEPADRSPNRWAKIKPDYVNVETDLDVLIIGAMYGEGHRRGGQLSNFLLGIAERPKAGGFPTKFHTFCRVGTGFSETELDALRTKLAPYLRRNERGSKPPSFYVCTGHHKERPDVWVDQPEKSVIMQIKSDIRTIQTEVFATPFSLRFPRCQKIRYDKPWYDCLDLDSFHDMVLASGGNVVDGSQYTELAETGTQKKRVKPEKAKLPLVPAHLMGTDVSGVKQKSTIFDGCVFYFANFSPEHGKDAMHRLVAEHGGAFSMNQIDAVTHMIADRKEGPYYQAAARRGDVIHTSWVFDCIEARELLHVRPKYYLHLSEVTRQDLRSQIDEYGDSYCDDLDTGDLAQLFCNMDPSRLHLPAHSITQLEDKYDRGTHWGVFRGCHVYMHRPIHSSNEDSQAVAAAALRRLALDVRMYGGTVLDQLTDDVTHMVVFATADYPVTHDMVVRSLTARERTLLRERRIRIVGHFWVEACRDIQRPVKETEYLIRSEDGDSVDPIMEEVPSPQPEMSSDDEALGNPSPVPTPAKPSIYELNTRPPAPRSAKKAPPSVIKVRSRRDSIGQKLPESEVGGSIQVENEREDGTGSEVTSAKPDIYALNMKPPPKGGRKKAGGTGGGRGTRRGVKTEEEVLMLRVKRSRAAKTKLTSAEGDDDVSGESEGAGVSEPALALALRPRRAAAVAARGRLTSRDEGSDVSLEESESKPGELDLETRQRQEKGRGRGRLRKVGEENSEGEDHEGRAKTEARAEVKAEVKEEALSLEDRGNAEGADGLGLDKEPKPEPDGDVRPDVGGFTGEGIRQRRKGRRETVAVKEEVKEEEAEDPGPVGIWREGDAETKGLDRYVTNRTGAEDERKVRTRALFTRKRDAGNVNTSREPDSVFGVKVKDEPVSQIEGPESQVGPGERFDGGHVAEPEWGREDGEGDAASDPGKVKGELGHASAERASVVVDETRMSAPHFPDTTSADDRRGGLGAVDPPSGARLAEDASRAEAGSVSEATPKKKRKVNFREQMKAMGL